MMVYQDGIEVDAGIYAGLEVSALTTVFETLIAAVPLNIFSIILRLVHSERLRNRYCKQLGSVNFYGIIHIQRYITSTEKWCS